MFPFIIPLHPDNAGLVGEQLSCLVQEADDKNRSHHREAFYPDQDICYWGRLEWGCGLGLEKGQRLPLRFLTSQQTPTPKCASPAWPARRQTGCRVPVLTVSISPRVLRPSMERLLLQLPATLVAGSSICQNMMKF